MATFIYTTPKGKHCSEYADNPCLAHDHKHDDYCKQFHQYLKKDNNGVDWLKCEECLATCKQPINQSIVDFLEDYKYENVFWEDKMEAFNNVIKMLSEDYE
jgi:hypothetical protein